LFLSFYLSFFYSISPNFAFVNRIIVIIPDRYRHTYQFKWPGKAEVIERVEAVHHILGIMRKLKVPWERVLLRPLITYHEFE